MKRGLRSAYQMGIRDNDENHLYGNHRTESDLRPRPAGVFHVSNPDDYMYHICLYLYLCLASSLAPVPGHGHVRTSHIVYYQEGEVYAIDSKGRILKTFLLIYYGALGEETEGDVGNIRRMAACGSRVGGFL